MIYFCAAPQSYDYKFVCLRESILEHLQTIHKNQEPDKSATLFCTICHEEYRTHIHWRKHIEKKHSKVINRQCLICGRICKTYRIYIEHTRTHREKTHQCPHCDLKFPYPSTLRAHIDMHSGQKPAMCDLCGFTTKYAHNMERHILGVHGNKKQSKQPVAHCSKCGEDFVTLREFKAHLKEKHVESVEAMMQEYRAWMDLYCRLCRKRFASLEELSTHNVESIEKHRMRKDKAKKYTDKNYKSRYVYPKKESLYECHICKNMFRNQKMLASHITHHSKKPRPHSCKVCVIYKII